MYRTILDDPNIEKKFNKKAILKITKFALTRSILEMEGYASIEGLITKEEDRIRKTLVFVPILDIPKLREADETLEDLTDEEITGKFTFISPLENCPVSAIDTNTDNPESLAGFKGKIDFLTLNSGKPLPDGEYNLFLRLEQLPNDSDEYKYEKVLSIQGAKRFFKQGIFSSKIDHFASNLVSKYNFILIFDNYSKSIRLKNILLQSYDPRLFSIDGKEVKRERRIVKAIKNRLFKGFYYLFHIFPINRKKIVFASDSRSDLNGNLYFVYEELSKRDLDLKVKFLLRDRTEETKSIWTLIHMAYQFATAKIILLDDFYPLIYPLRIRNKADLIQVWHAAGAFKTFGFSRMGRPGGPKITSKNHRNYTKVAVSSENVRKHYAEGFGIDVDKVYATGVPRSDIFFDEEYKEYVKQTLYKKYPLLKNKKVILFAPTFRGKGQLSAYYPFEHLNWKKLYEELSNEYVFLLKIHPFVKNKPQIPIEYNDFFYNFSSYREINDLLLLTDILITDYSSVCFEFALLGKPMVFFSFDVEEYTIERDFYYDYYDFIPGPLVKTTEELVQTIRQEKFQTEKIKPFVNKFFADSLGHASKAVVDELIIPSLEDLVEEEKIEDNSKKIIPPSSRIELFEKAIQQDEENGRQKE